MLGFFASLYFILLTHFQIIDLVHLYHALDIQTAPSLTATQATIHAAFALPHAYHSPIYFHVVFAIHHTFDEAFIASAGFE